jgi:hypothetical protein
MLLYRLDFEYALNIFIFIYSVYTLDFKFFNIILIINIKISFIKH